MLSRALLRTRVTRKIRHPYHNTTGAFCALQSPAKTLLGAQRVRTHSCFDLIDAHICTHTRRNFNSSPKIRSTVSQEINKTANGSKKEGGSSSTGKDPGGRYRMTSLLVATAALGLGIVAIRAYSNRTFPFFSSRSAKIVDDRPDYLPRFRLSEVREHGAHSPCPWVTYEDRVYDITDWVGAHPGGDVILRAAGASIEPYWNIFAIHKTGYAQEVLNQFLIGFIDVQDLTRTPDGKLRPVLSNDVEDPFADDPARDPRLLTLAAKPRSAETPQDDLSDYFLTPTRTFYVRNHMWVPSVPNDAAERDAHVLTVELLDGSERTYSLKELRERFKTYKITAALQCAGNRRSHMTTGAARQTNGLQWGVGAISNAEWEGVKLADVLADAASNGMLSSSSSSLPSYGPWNQEKLFGRQSKHVWFSGLEAYGASIPLSTAFDPRSDVLLAFGMNGEPLPRDHGAPLRALVPGHVAARSVKFLNRVTVATEESPTQWQQRDYKCFGPNQTKAEDIDWDSAPAIQEMPITSAFTRITLDGTGQTKWSVVGETGGAVVRITEPTTTETSVSARRQPSQDDGRVEEKVSTNAIILKENLLPKGGDKEKAPSARVSLRGYAYSGGGREVIRVDVSLDGGQTWTQARFLDNSNKLADASLSAAAATSFAPEKSDDDMVHASCKGSKYWAWKRWEASAELPAEESVNETYVEGQGIPGKEGVEGQKRCIHLVCKATDESYNTQPEDYGAIFNPRGNLSCAWHRLTLCTEGKCEEKGATLMDRSKAGEVGKVS